MDLNKTIKSTKCNYNNCLKKLSITEAMTCSCKCGNTYCLLHRHSESHECNYNYKSEINVTEYIEKNKCNKLKIIKL